MRKTLVNIMTERFDWPYSLSDGDLFHTDSRGNRKRICHQGGAIALAYDTEDGVLHCHGEYNEVRQWFDETRMRLFRVPATVGLANALALISMPLDDACVQEVNRCIAVTGAVLGVERRLPVHSGLGLADIVSLTDNPGLSMRPVV